MRALRFIICLLLFPLTVWYAAGVAVRNLLFDWGWKRSVRPDVPTIGIGNLRVGGTGKTPHTEYILRLLSGRRTALLSRGYGRLTTGFVKAGKESDASQIGDEPQMIARKFPDITVAVCEERTEGVKRLMESELPPEVIVLDDVYQHRKITPALNILLTEYADPYSSDWVLPFGNLRESRRGSRRADIVVVTKCPATVVADEQGGIRKQLKLNDRQKLFFSHIEYGNPVALYGTPIPEKIEQVLLVTGIARPEPLAAHLEKQYRVTHLRFPDHHRFGPADCRRIADAFNALPANGKAVITTEKDASRLAGDESRKILGGLPVLYVPITVAFQDGEAFDKTINDFLS